MISLCIVQVNTSMVRSAAWYAIVQDMMAAKTLKQWSSCTIVSCMARNIGSNYTYW